MNKKKSNHKQTLGFMIWILILGVGLERLMTYSNTPGKQDQGLSQWPAQSTLIPGKNLPTLVAFLHPLCPCSRATVSELERLLVTLNHHAKIHAVFFEPKEESDSWITDSALWKKTKNLPGIDASIDHEGAEAKRFHASTSGQVYLYTQEGKLEFQGGITPARGHEGGSTGQQMILSYFKNEPLKTHISSVFGCSLQNPDRAPRGENK